MFRGGPHELITGAGYQPALTNNPVVNSNGFLDHAWPFGGQACRPEGGDYFDVPSIKVRAQAVYNAYGLLTASV